MSIANTTPQSPPKLGGEDRRSEVVLGFTLLELLIVIGIVAILASLGALVYSRLTRQGRDSRRKADVQAVATSIDQYYLNNDQLYPASTSCAGAETYLEKQTLPIDPQNSGDYIYDWNGSCDQVGGQYCVCALMEVAGTGNAYGRVGGVCTWTGAGSRDYFCITSKQ